MKVLVVGSGGREHVLAWRLAKSPSVEKVYCAPGNAGIAEVAECVDIDPRDFSSLIEFAKENSIDLTVPGPEQPLVEGIVDEFKLNGLNIFGPTKKAAMLEGSKAFSKQLMAKHGIPTARFDVFSNPYSALNFADKIGYPVVIKADGLAAGKGAIICNTTEEAEQTITDMIIDRKFGFAGDTIVVEEFLVGKEVSVFALVSESDILILPFSQDHKAVYDGDEGPNTGGMGAFSPVGFVKESEIDFITRDVIVQTVHAMANEGCPYSGVLFAGLILTAKGPYVLEFNCRFGDPEAQVVLPRLKGDFGELLLAASTGTLGKAGENISWDERAAVCVVMASGGYPIQYRKGFPITGLDGDFDPDVVVFHSGTKKKFKQTVTNGGRVLGVTALGDTFAEARKKAYSAVSSISFQGAFFRTDIGSRRSK